MIAAHLEDSNTVGQWMAHHLSELVTAAQDATTTTVEQRQQIVQTILKVWTHRRSYPGRAPLEEFSNVFVALERLGDGSPWKFSGLLDPATEISDSSPSGLPLVTTAAELERLTRETLLRLIWLAAQDAKEKNQEWLEAAEKVASVLENDVTTSLWRIRRRAARRLHVVDDDPRNILETPVGDSSAEDNAEGSTGSLTEGTAADDIVARGVGDARDDLLDEDEDDPLSAINHVKRLREMAELLNKLADSLAAPGRSL